MLLYPCGVRDIYVIHVFIGNEQYKWAIMGIARFCLSIKINITIVPARLTLCETVNVILIIYGQRRVAFCRDRKRKTETANMDIKLFEGQLTTTTLSNRRGTKNLFGHEPCERARV